jgi:hypothetical protein
MLPVAPCSRELLTVHLLQIRQSPVLNNEWRKGSPVFPEKIDLSEIGVENHQEAEERDHEQENA